MPANNLASPGSRVVAVIIDMVILFVISAILAIPMGISMMPFAMMDPNSFNAFAMMSAWTGFGALMFILWLVYFTYFEANGGQTPGKKAMNIKVVKEGGSALTYVDAFLRSLLRIVDQLPFLYILGLVVILITEKKQRIGDLVAGTLVVKA